MSAGKQSMSRCWSLSVEGTAQCEASCIHVAVHHFAFPTLAVGFLHFVASWCIESRVITTKYQMMFHMLVLVTRFVLEKYLKEDITNNPWPSRLLVQATWGCLSWVRQVIFREPTGPLKRLLRSCPFSRDIGSLLFGSWTLTLTNHAPSITCSAKNQWLYWYIL